MKSIKIKLSIFFKELIILLKPHIYLNWISHPILTISNFIQLSKWISKQKNKDILNDFYSSKRDHSKRTKLYQYVVEKYNLKNEKINYLEFGVCKAFSFKWWLENCNKQENSFYGFDTFEGLPENWGAFNKGDMAAGLPDINDHRAKFIKGLFQDTLFDFIKENSLNNKDRKIIHLDADLFSSTIFVLTTLAPYLKSGDILFFDEFNVPNHEFSAFKIFTESFYVKTKLIGAVNNYYQVAFIIE